MTELPHGAAKVGIGDGRQNGHAQIWHTKAGLPAVGFLGAANVLAAAIFGLGHLPTAVAARFPLSSIVVAYELVGNGLLGITFDCLI